MSWPAAGNEPPAQTMVISAETICAQTPNAAYCRQNNIVPGRPATAVPPLPVPATGKAVARQPARHSTSIQALEANAPWMKGFVRWCEAFPGHRACAAPR